MKRTLEIISFVITGAFIGLCLYKAFKIYHKSLGMYLKTQGQKLPTVWQSFVNLFHRRNMDATRQVIRPIAGEDFP